MMNLTRVCSLLAVKILSLKIQDGGQSTFKKNKKNHFMVNYGKN